MLRSPESGHDCYIAQTERAGRVAVHTARDEAGLAVTSVIADPGVATADVLAAAHEAAAGTAARTSLFDLPLGDSPLWSIAEAAIPSGWSSGGLRRRTARVVARGRTTSWLGWPGSVSTMRPER